MENFKYGAIPSPVDDRDYRISDLIACSSVLPSEYINPIVGEIPILNQGQTEMCVACSIAYLRWLQEYNQSGNRAVFSPAYIYGNRTNEMHDGEGMVPREALSTATTYGDCLYDEFPGFYTFYEAKKLYKKDKNKLDSKAKPYRVSSYYRVSGEIEVKNTVMQLGGVSAMFPVYNCLNMVRPDGKVPWLGETNKYLGFHQMTIVGWTEKYWIVLNSWGENWGKNGFCYLPYKYKWEEAWAIVDDINEVKQDMKFPDVEETRWSARAIDWVSDNGKMSGFEDGTFRPTEPLTREQMAFILYNQALQEGEV